MAVHIQAGGNVVGGYVPGSGNVIVGRDSVVNGSVVLAPGQLQGVDPRIAGSLVTFSQGLQAELDANAVPLAPRQELREELEGLGADLKDLPPDQPAPLLRKASLTSRVARVARKVLAVLPGAATAGLFAALGPVGGIIGATVQEVLNGVAAEG